MSYPREGKIRGGSILGSTRGGIVRGGMSYNRVNHFYIYCNGRERYSPCISQISSSFCSFRSNHLCSLFESVAVNKLNNILTFFSVKSTSQLIYKMYDILYCAPLT